MHCEKNIFFGESEIFFCMCACDDDDKELHDKSVWMCSMFPGQRKKGLRFFSADNNEHGV